MGVLPSFITTHCGGGNSYRIFRARVRRGGRRRRRADNFPPPQFVFPRRDAPSFLRVRRFHPFRDVVGFCYFNHGFLQGTGKLLLTLKFQGG